VNLGLDAADKVVKEAVAQAEAGLLDKLGERTFADLLAQSA
jgi:hypothetical protein